MGSLFFISISAVTASSSSSRGRPTNERTVVFSGLSGASRFLFRTSTPSTSTHRAPVTPEIEDRLIYGNEGVQGRGGANNGRAAATVIESNDSDCSS